VTNRDNAKQPQGNAGIAVLGYKDEMCKTGNHVSTDAQPEIDGYAANVKHFG